MGTILGTLFEVMPLFCPITITPVPPRHAAYYRRSGARFSGQMGIDAVVVGPFVRDGGEAQVRGSFVRLSINCPATSTPVRTATP